MPATGTAVLPEDPTSKYFGEVLYLLPVSKDMEVSITIANATDRAEACAELVPRRSLKRRGRMVMTLLSHLCEDTVNSATVTVDPILMIFAGSTGTARGLHVGTFRWTGPEGRIRGRLSGTTNVSTTRTPFESADRDGSCDRPCHLPGTMDGRMSGLLQTTEPFKDYLIATYHIVFDASDSGSSTAGKGCLEGVIVRQCRSA